MLFAPQIHTNQKARHTTPTQNNHGNGARAGRTRPQPISALSGVPSPTSGGMVLSDALIIAMALDQLAVHGLRQTSHSKVPGGDSRAAGVSQRISAHARIALPESGGLVLSDALIVPVVLA